MITTYIDTSVDNLNRLILATGASAWVPPIQNSQAEGCFVLRDADGKAVAVMAARGVNVPPGIPVHSLSEVPAAAAAMAGGDGQVVVKSQILAGGRGARMADGPTCGCLVGITIDGGKSWKKMGLEKTRNIHRIIVDPSNPNTVYAGAIGNPYAEHPERGVFKTTDGGQNWEKILFTNDTSGVADMIMDPSNPNKLFVAMWQHRRTPWSLSSGGPGSGLGGAAVVHGDVVSGAGQVAGHGVAHHAQA